MKLLATGAAQIPKEAKHTARDLPRGARILSPGDHGYHGPHGNDSSGTGPRAQWEFRVKNGRNARTRPQTRQEQNNELADDYTNFNRKWGRIHGGLAAGMTVAGVGGGAALNSYGDRRAAKIRSGQVKVGKAVKVSGVHVDAADPLIRHATQRRGVHNITSVPTRGERIGARLKATERNISDVFGRNPNATLTAGMALGYGGLYAGASRGGEKIKRAERDRKRQLRATVTKRGGQSAFRQAFGTPRRAVRTLATNPEHLAAGGILGAGVGAQHPSFERKRTQAQRNRADTATGAVVGGAAGQAGWLATGYEIRRRGHKVERTRPKGMSRSQYQRIMREHHHATGVPQNTKPDRAHAPAFYRNYPEVLPAAKYKRALGHMSGRKGAAIQSGIIAGGAMLGAGSVVGRRKAVGEPVHKALYQREERISPIRLAGTLAGGALTAYGLGHSRFVGSALARGVKMAHNADSHRAVQALQMAQAAQGVLRRGTAPGERALRQIQSVDHAVRAVPRSIRPEVALAAGVLLAGESQPVRRTHYKPVSRPIPVRPMGW